jgi:hypothetical protein
VKAGFSSRSDFNSPRPIDNSGRRGPPKRVPSPLVAPRPSPAFRPPFRGVRRGSRSYLSRSRPAAAGSALQQQGV